MKHLASRSNPHFKALKKLALSGRERRKTGCVLLDGIHLLQAYRQHFGAPEELVVSERGRAQTEISSFLLSENASTPVTVLSDDLFSEVATVDTPSGIMAIIRQPPGTRGLNQEIDTVVLDGLQDAGNVGSILRSSAAAGFRQILLSADCAQAWSPKTLRSAMGAHFQLDIHENCDLVAFLATYRGQAILTELSAESALYSLDLKKPVAWVFGHEGQGIRPEVAAATSRSIRIPMPGATESLNVAAAAAVCLFETVRQRQ